MKKLMMALALVGMSVATQAQERTKMSADQRARARTERMTKDLGLSAEQIARLEALNREQAKEAQVDRVARRSERDSRRAAMKVRRERYEADLKSILSAEQFSGWTARKEDMEQKHRQKRVVRLENRKQSLEQPEK
jgi:protein CpxP